MVISLQLRLWLLTPTWTLIALDITKTSSNNNNYCWMRFIGCLQLACEKEEMKIHTSISISLSLILSMISCGGCPSTVQPTDCAVPRISFTVPANLRAIDRGLMVLAISIIWSIVRLPLCLTVDQMRYNITYKSSHNITLESLNHVWKKSTVIFYCQYKLNF